MNEDLSADLACTESNARLISTERIAYKNFPLPEIKLYLVNRTIPLPSEY